MPPMRMFPNSAIHGLLARGRAPRRGAAGAPPSGPGAQAPAAGAAHAYPALLGRVPPADEDRVGADAAVVGRDLRVDEVVRPDDPGEPGQLVEVVLELLRRG